MNSVNSTSNNYYGNNVTITTASGQYGNISNINSINSYITNLYNTYGYITNATNTNTTSTNYYGSNATITNISASNISTNVVVINIGSVYSQTTVYINGLRIDIKASGVINIGQFGITNVNVSCKNFTGNASNSITNICGSVQNEDNTSGYVPT